jgi:5-methyltetrahydropteroyltriglutamate--homocysteine methyltransferase
LLQARADFADRRISAGQLRAVEDQAIREVAQMQRDVGLQSATDGEFRRASWHMDFIYQLGGIEQVAGEITVHFRNDDGTIDYTPAAIAVTDRVFLDHTIFEHDFEFLNAIVGQGATPKLTIPSPNMVHYRGGRAALDPSVYPDIEQFWADLATAYANQVRAIAELGCTYLQLDDTSLAYLNDPAQREAMQRRGEDPAHLHEKYVHNINNALDNRPEGLVITAHLCRGNFPSAWAAEGSYEFVAEAVFGGLDVDGFFLEYDDSRSGRF